MARQYVPFSFVFRRSCRGSFRSASCAWQLPVPRPEEKEGRKKVSVEGQTSASCSVPLTSSVYVSIASRPDTRSTSSGLNSRRGVRLIAFQTRYTKAETKTMPSVFFFRDAATKRISSSAVLVGLRSTHESRKLLSTHT